VISKIHRPDALHHRAASCPKTFDGRIGWVAESRRIGDESIAKRLVFDLFDLRNPKRFADLERKAQVDADDVQAFVSTGLFEARMLNSFCNAVRAVVISGVSLSRKNCLN